MLQQPLMPTSVMFGCSLVLPTQCAFFIAGGARIALAFDFKAPEVHRDGFEGC